MISRDQLEEWLERERNRRRKYWIVLVILVVPGILLAGNWMVLRKQ